MELGERAYNYKHKRWDEPFDLDMPSIQDNKVKEYIPQDDFTQRTYDRARKSGKDQYNSLIAALEPHKVHQENALHGIPALRQEQLDQLLLSDLITYHLIRGDHGLFLPDLDFLRYILPRIQKLEQAHQEIISKWDEGDDLSNKHFEIAQDMQNIAYKALVRCPQE